MTTSQDRAGFPLLESLWSRPVLADRFGPQPYQLRLDATQAERAAIAEAYGCLAVDHIEAELTITRRGQRLKVEGRLRAEVRQSCVVTLEPVASRIDEPVLLSFAPAETARPRRAETPEIEETIAFEGEDPPEPIVNGQVDLGAAMLELFGLALDPYPRKAGAEFGSAPAEPRADHPFAALGKLKSPR